MTYKAFVLMALVSVFSAQSAIASENTSMNFTRQKVTTLQEDEFDYLFDDIDEIKISPWENWGLTEVEWKKYTLIKEKTAWATWDGNPSPLQLLAIYSRDAEEKRRYARLEARIDQWRITTAMNYQTIYSEEAKVLAAKYLEVMQQYRSNADAINASDTTALFVDVVAGKDCDARCRSVVAQLLRNKPIVNVFVVGKASQDDVFSWAKSAGISVDAVRSGLITLNFDKGEYEQLTKISSVFGAFPVAYIQRSDGWQRLSL